MYSRYVRCLACRYTPCRTIQEPAAGRPWLGNQPKNKCAVIFFFIRMNTVDGADAASPPGSEALEPLSAAPATAATPAALYSRPPRPELSRGQLLLFSYILYQLWLHKCTGSFSSNQLQRLYQFNIIPIQFRALNSYVHALGRSGKPKARSNTFRSINTSDCTKYITYIHSNVKIRNDVINATSVLFFTLVDRVPSWLPRIAAGLSSLS